MLKQERLKVIENQTEYYVVYESSDIDWVAKFDKKWGEAKDWAFHMADVYNSRLTHSEP